MQDDMRKKINDLVDKLNEYAYWYYVKDAPKVSDHEYDRLFDELHDLEKKYPELIRKNSPTQRVGGDPLDEFGKFPHDPPMLSMQKAYTLEDIIDFEERIKRFLNTKDITVEHYMEPKYDGLSCEIRYIDGYYHGAGTRGNGSVGEDVTENIKTIRNIPLSVPVKGELLVRGEILIKKEDLIKLNEERLKNNEEPFANPRNAAAGSIRQLNPKITASRKLHFIAYDIANYSYLGIKEQTQIVDILEEYGFQIPDKRLSVNKPEDIFAEFKKIEAERESYPFEIDGLVIKVDDKGIQEKLGSSSNNPRWAIALKFSAKEKITKVVDIKFSLGRTGAVTPVIELEPVEIAGAMIKHASLHNAEIFSNFNIARGDTVLIQRAGDIIPQVVKVMERSGNTPIEFPQNCPVCSQKLFKDIETPIVRCINIDCPAKIYESIVHFVSKEAFNVDGLGKQQIKRFLDEGIIKSIPDIFDIEHHKEIMLWDGYGERSFRNLTDSIERSKNIKFSRLIYSLGIREIGAVTAKLLHKHFPDLDELINAKKEELTHIDGIGEIVAENIYDYFKNEANPSIIKKLFEKGVKIDYSIEMSDDTLSGLSFIFTGELENISRNAAKSEVEKRGGRVVSSISSAVDYVVVGNKPGSKHKKAVELGLKIIDENEFERILSEGI